VGRLSVAASVDAAVPLVDAARPVCGDTVVVAVDGPSGSGKSTLATALATALATRPRQPGQPGQPQVLRMDDIYPGWDGLADAVPNLHDWVLAPLARGERAAYRRFDWVAGRYAEEHEVPAAPLLIVEGVGSSVGVCAQYIAVALWVETTLDERFRRAIARDGEAYRPHWERWARQEQALFEADRTRSRAALIVAT